MDCSRHSSEEATWPDLSSLVRVSDLSPGFVSFWNIYDDATVSGVNWNLTLVDCVIDWGWEIYCFDSEVSIDTSSINYLYLSGVTNASVFDSNLGNYYLYFGRLAKEKGLADLINVFGELGKINLKIVGAGPLEESLKETAQVQNLNNIEFLGFQTGDALKELIVGARAVVVPTLLYDNYPYGVLESQAFGKAVVASRMGGIPEMVENNISGYLYEPRNKFDLRARVEDTMRENGELKEVGRAARARVEKENGSELHYQKLMSIYNSLV